VKWIRRILIALAVVVGGVVLAAFLTALRTSIPWVSRWFEQPAVDGGSIPIAVWYPTDARPDRPPCWVRC